MSSRNSSISDQLYEYILGSSLRDRPELKALRDETADMEAGAMQVSPDQGQFMALMTRAIGARTALEVGTFTGYSALVVAAALPADGTLVACDISAEWTAVGRRYWEQAGVSDKIDLRIGPAVESLDGLLAEGRAGEFDMAFIDADKENYPAYYERCLKLLRPGGLIMVDNVLWGGKVADATDTQETTVTIRKLTDTMKHDERIDFSLLPVGDGLSLAVKR